MPKTAGLPAHQHTLAMRLTRQMRMTPRFDALLRLRRLDAERAEILSHYPELRQRRASLECRARST